MANPFTPSTIPLLALAIYLWQRAKGDLLPVVMFLSVFQGASVFNVGLGGLLLGIGPSYFLLPLALLQKIDRGRQRESPIGRPLPSTTLLLLAFAAYAAASSFVYPRLFQGVLFTNSKFGSLLPLEWSAGFLPQVIYLLGSVSLYLVAAYRATSAEIVRALEWFAGGALLASGIAVYQFAAMKTGLPFPEGIFHTNPSYGRFSAYEVNGFPRMDATFSEASTAAFFFAIALAFSVWKLFSSPLTPGRAASSLLLLSGLLLTISTTGYVCLGFVAAVAGWLYIARWRGDARDRAAKLLLAAPASALLALLLVHPAGQEFVEQAVRTILLDKTQTASYIERSQWNEDAYSTAAQTHWLGAGWGVCRASSVFPTLLGNVGIPGALLFGVCALRPFVLACRRPKRQRPVHGAVLFSLATAFLALLLSVPELTAQILWLLFAVDSRLAAAASHASQALHHHHEL